MMVPHKYRRVLYKYRRTNVRREPMFRLRIMRAVGCRWKWRKQFAESTKRWLLSDWSNTRV